MAFDKRMRKEGHYKRIMKYRRRSGKQAKSKWVVMGLYYTWMLRMLIIKDII